MGKVPVTSSDPVDPALVGECWKVFEGDRNGFLLLGRFNEEMCAAAGHPGHPVQITVSVPIREPNEERLPGWDEHLELEVIEELVVDRAGTRGRLVGVVTADALRELVLYSASDDWVEPFARELAESVTTHQVTVTNKHDPDWSVFCALFTS